VTGRYVPQFYVYQNSFSGGIGCIGDNGCVYPEDGMTNSMFLNNIFNGGMYYYSNGNSQWTNSWMGPFAYNIITPPWPTYPSTNVPSWFGTNNIVLTNLVWVNASNMNFHLPPNSVAFDAAIDVTQPFTINGVTYPALPVTADQKGGSAWDIGALEDTIPPPLMLRIVGPGN
jgi:hypothetical protein